MFTQTLHRLLQTQRGECETLESLANDGQVWWLRWRNQNLFNKRYQSWILASFNLRTEQIEKDIYESPRTLPGCAKASRLGKRSYDIPKRNSCHIVVSQKAISAGIPCWYRGLSEECQKPHVALPIGGATASGHRSHNRAEEMLNPRRED